MLCKCHLFRLLISRCKKRINGQLKKWLTAHCASKHMLNHFRQTIYTKWSVKNEVLLLFSFFFSMALQRSYNHTAVLFWRRSSLINYKFAIEHQIHNNIDKKKSIIQGYIPFVEWMKTTATSCSNRIKFQSVSFSL